MSIETQLNEALKERERIYKVIAPLSEQVKKLSTTIAQLREQQAVELDLDTMSRAEQIEYFLFEDGLVNGTRYNRRRAFWAANGLTTNGYFSEAGQVALQICMYEGNDEHFETVFATLTDVFPHLKLNDGVKAVRISVGDSSMGMFYLVMDGDKFVVRCTYYRSVTTLYESDSLRDALMYVHEHVHFEAE